MSVFRYLSIFSVELLVALSLIATAQETQHRVETPSAASVSAGQSQRLVPGQVFSFQLRFDKAPDGYGGGWIYYEFQTAGSPSAFGRSTVGNKTDLHDGQAIYTLSLPITDSMLPGSWSLAKVTLGRNVPRAVPISDNVSFVIPSPPPVVLHVRAPASVRAGRMLTFSVTLDEYPRGLAEGCEPALHGYLRQAVPNLNALAVRLKNLSLKPNQLSYEFSGLIDPETPAGPWQGEVHLLVQRPGGEDCRPLQEKGDNQFAFSVEPALGLVTPTSVAVTVNPSQIQLLLGEADRLKAKAQHLRDKLTSDNETANQVLLRASLLEAIADVDKTEQEYKQNGVEQPSTRAVNAFFDDIRYEYGEALKSLANESARAPQNEPQLLPVGATAAGSSSHLTRASAAALKSILHNAIAYEVAASAGTLTVNLNVVSYPQGATVSYWQRTDPETTTLDSKTNCQIPNLYRAGYQIRFQKSGYEEQTIPFDGQDSSATMIIAHLVRKGRPR